VKRQGRAEEHLALFYPETIDEHDALFRIMLKKSGVTTPVQSIKDVIEDPSGLSGADIEAILARAVLAADAAAGDGDLPVTAETLRQAFNDFIPATSPLERELQILVAVQECTSREVLPETYRAMEREVVLARINELRGLLNS
jgi:SpoVK/Ycf46/Vps4 family AAA+-type ATPase